MENKGNSLLNWVYYTQGKTMEELRRSLLYTTTELEQTKMAVQDELKKRDEQLMQHYDMIQTAVKEKDEAQERYHKLVLEKNLLLQKQEPQNRHLGVSRTNKEEQEQGKRGNDSNNNGLSSSDGEESIVSSFDPPNQIPKPQEDARTELGFLDKPLPEKGKLLQAVMKAGPLLQTLLLAGPLPKWQHPPPRLDCFEIPPVTIPPPPPPPPPSPPLQDSLVINCGKLNRKRVFCDGSDSPRKTKYQRIVLN